jgi:hypothetical protein
MPCLPQFYLRPASHRAYQSGGALVATFDIVLQRDWQVAAARAGKVPMPPGSNTGLDNPDGLSLVLGMGPVVANAIQVRQRGAAAQGRQQVASPLPGAAAAACMCSAWPLVIRPPSLPVPTFCASPQHYSQMHWFNGRVNIPFLLNEIGGTVPLGQPVINRGAGPFVPPPAPSPPPATRRPPPPPSPPVARCPAGAQCCLAGVTYDACTTDSSPGIAYTQYYKLVGSKLLVAIR